jgi:hypothetical protein
MSELTESAPRRSFDRSAQTFDRRFFAITAVVAILLVLIGFSPSFYLRSWFNSPALSTLLYVHGALMTAWYVLFAAQVLLVSARRVDIHRRFGILVAFTGAALVPTGIATAIAFIRRVAGDAEESELAAVIAGYQFVALTLFTLLVVTALAFRGRSDIHKRLMTVASLSLLGPPLARLTSDEVALWLNYAVVLLPIAIDTWRHRRLHPAFGWAGGLFLVSSQAALQFASSDSWIRFALRVFR